MAPFAEATPDSDAADAIDQAWQAAGGDESVVGSKDGDVFAVGEGFGQNFTDGAYYFTPATGAHLLYGAILEKYRALGGPGDGDLGFPTIDEVTGLVGPDSRVSTFSASDKPAIFWTPDSGAWVVRGAINAAWDKLGGSAGTLGVPVADETYNGDVVDQKFANGEISWNRLTKAFTTVPADLAGQLTDVAVPTDPGSAINDVWRAAGGLSGPLGARQGAQYSIGGDGTAQAYIGGKIFYSPQTGAHAVTGAILSKYESAGGPTGDLGYPTGKESDGGAPNSRVSAFSAADKPVIFWTPDNGAIIVRGAINAAWAKLGGATGKLGVPIGQQSVDGDTVTQKFSGGQISWNKSTGKFTTNPGELAAALGGVEVPKGSAATLPNVGAHKGFSWQWWWLLVIIPGLLLVGVIGFGMVWLQRRRDAANGHHDDWPQQPETSSDTYNDLDDRRPSAAAPESGWSPAKTMPGVEDVFDGDQDSVDTTPTRIPDDPRYGERRDESDEPLDVEEADVEQTDAEVSDVVESDAEQSDGDLADADAVDVDEDGHNVDDLETDDIQPDDVRADGVDEWTPSRPVVLAKAPRADREGTVEEDEEPPARAGRHSAAHAGESQFRWTVDVGEKRPSGRRRAAPERIDTVRPRPSEPRRAEPTRAAAEPDPARPAIHLPLSDPYQPPDGYPIKANTHSGLYYTPDCALYDHTVPEVWFASGELAQANGFVKAE
jgi:uncharacterized protein with LGFP repeats